MIATMGPQPACSRGSVLPSQDSIEGENHVERDQLKVAIRDPKFLERPLAAPQSLHCIRYTRGVYTAMVMRSVRLSRRAEKDLKRVPEHIAFKLRGWIDAVEYEGLERVRRVPGYHDEPLQGNWFGHRSIRLSSAYRAIYRITTNESLELAYVERVTKHEY